MTKAVKWTLGLVALLIFINLGLVYLYFSRQYRPSSASKEVVVGSQDDKGYALTVVDTPLDQAGFRLTVSNPSYDYQENQGFFNFQAQVENQTFQPFLKLVFNCDTSQRQGVGVSLSGQVPKEVFPGSQAQVEAEVILVDNQEQVLSCVYTPQGVFTSQETVRVVF